jgi:plasmid stabilization system protein ParE
MQIELVFAESAVLDLEDIRTYYCEQDVPDVGKDLVDEILCRIEGLLVHPELGRIVPEFGQKFLREIIYPPFRIVYKTGLCSENKKQRIEVVRVWRSERLLIIPD